MEASVVRLLTLKKQLNDHELMSRLGALGAKLPVFIPKGLLGR